VPCRLLSHLGPCTQGIVGVGHAKALAIWGLAATLGVNSTIQMPQFAALLRDACRARLGAAAPAVGLVADGTPNFALEDCWALDGAIAAVGLDSDVTLCAGVGVARCVDSDWPSWATPALAAVVIAACVLCAGVCWRRRRRLRDGAKAKLVETTPSGAAAEIGAGSEQQRMGCGASSDRYAVDGPTTAPDAAPRQTKDNSHDDERP
jgi:hypothetical protein